MHHHLDLSAIEVFILIADLRSFSQTADVLGMTQGGVSLKLSRLERVLGQRLVDRTPRHIRLSPAGEGFLPSARALLAAQESALNSSELRPCCRLTLGVSEYVAGKELPDLLAQLAAHDPSLMLEVTVGTSRELLNAYSQKELDAVIVRQEYSRTDGEPLFELNFGWFAASAAPKEQRDPLRLITVAEPRDMACVRSAVLQALKREGIVSKDVFIGSGIPAVLAAVSAGLGVAPLPLRLAPADTIEVGKPWKLPPLPSWKVFLYSGTRDRKAKDTLRIFAQGVRTIRTIGMNRDAHLEAGGGRLYDAPPPFTAQGRDPGS